MSVQKQQLIKVTQENYINSFGKPKTIEENQENSEKQNIISKKIMQVEKEEQNLQIIENQNNKEQPKNSISSYQSFQTVNSNFIQENTTQQNENLKEKQDVQEDKMQNSKVIIDNNLFNNDQQNIIQQLKEALSKREQDLKNIEQEKINLKKQLEQKEKLQSEESKQLQKEKEIALIYMKNGIERQQVMQEELQGKTEQYMNLQQQIEQMQQSIQAQEQIRVQMHNHILQLRGKLQIYCRVKPIDETNVPSTINLVYNQHTPGKQCEAQILSLANTNNKKNQYSLQKQKNSITDNNDQRQSNQESPCNNDQNFYFDQVFDQSVDQPQVFQRVKPFVQAAIDGQFCSIIAYGQTGSGKTYTLEGRHIEKTQDMDDQNCGILPRTALFFLQEKQRQQGINNFKIQISALEIYNDTVTDLLDGKTNMNIHTTSKGEVKVDGQVFYDAESAEQMMEIIQKASKNRKKEATNANSQSSRSHSIYQINVIQENKSKKDGILKIVDLAGSERYEDHNLMSDTCTPNKNSINNNNNNQNNRRSLEKNKNGYLDMENLQKEQKKLQLEANYINKSLTTLGRVIKLVAEQKFDKQQIIPYRENKLTRLLQDCIGGNAKTILFITVCPTEKNQTQTKESLQFASKSMF